ncbi:ABC transporter substrate-binding protein [Paenibacillus filicis]|uniref:ABC transporter substrate-binding protein n=1 Tax=Paenibacillus filicis TaxID=669464 RepID=A0ABU9DCV8_9BACL
MNRKLRWSMAGQIALAMSLLLSACSSPNAASTPSSSPASGKAAEAVKAKPLTIALTGDATSLDPQNASDSISSLVTYQIFDRLVTFNDKLDIVPQLAESWTHSKDGKEWTFQLRKGVKFQDGTPLNAEAVKTSFERVADKSKKLSQYTLVGQFIDSITTNGESEVVFHLKAPQAALLNNLAVSPSGILSPKSIKENEAGISKNPVGTGPFQLKAWTPGNELVLEPNPHYWGDKQQVSSVTFRTVPENSARVIMLESGEADVIEKVPNSEVARLEKNSSLTVHSRLTNRVLYIGINTTNAPFNDVKVRKALNAAIDRDTLINKLYEGRVKPATSFIAQHTFGYSNVGQYTFSPEQANQWLQEAGVKPGTPLRIILAGNTVQDRPAAEFVQNSLQKIGFKAELKVLELGAYLEALKDPKNYDLFVRGASSTTGDADTLLRDSFFSTSTSNYAHYTNPEVDKLLKESGEQVNKEERQKLYATVQKIVKEDAPWIPLHEDLAYVGLSKKVQGITFLPTLFWDLRNVKVQ